MSNDNTENYGEIICFSSDSSELFPIWPLDHKMPKRRTKSKHVEGVKAKSEESMGKSSNVRVTKAKSKAKGEDKNKDHKDVDDEVELDCRFCDFTSESEKILRKHIRSAHSADTR